MRASAERTPAENKQALLQYLIAFTGGYLGVYPVLFVAKSFASAQTANIVNMMVNLSDLDFFKVLLRVLGLLVFVSAVVLATYLPKHAKNIDIRKLAILVDALDAVVLILLPEETQPLLAVLPNYFAMALQWSCFPGAYGFVCATIFQTNNTKMVASAWTEVYLNHDDSYRLKLEFYGLNLLSYSAGVLSCSILAHITGRYASLFVFIPLSAAWLLHNHILTLTKQ